MSSPLIIEFWSDVVCPWCWIGWVRLNKALEGFDQARNVRVVHRAFRLMPNTPPTPVAEIIAHKMRTPASNVAAMLRQVESAAASEGLSYRLEGTQVGDTLDAHRLIKFAAEQGNARELVERFYRAYLSEQRSVFDHSSLLALASEVGLELERAEAVLEGDAFRVDVESDQRALQALGGNGVPFVRIGERHVVSGAQPAEIVAQALRQAWEARPITIGEGAVCGPEGCAVPPT